MKVQVVVMLMDVSVRSRHLRMAGRKLFAEPFHHPGEIEHAEQNQHQAHGEFHGEAGTGRDDHAEENDGAADNGNRERVAAAPEDTNEASFQDGTLAADDGGNGNDVIGISGVAHAKEETDYKNGETTGQGCAPIENRKL